MEESDSERLTLVSSMEKEQFDDICSRLNIDEITKRNAIQQFEEISRNTILDVRFLNHSEDSMSLLLTQLIKATEKTSK